MSAFANLQCLKESGRITESQYEQMVQIIAKLPSTSMDLLPMIVALLLLQDSEVAFSKPPIAIEAVASTGPLDPHALSSIPSGATMAKVTTLGNNIIFRIDATNPVSVARVCKKDESFTLRELSGFRFASQTGTANIFVEYY